MRELLAEQTARARRRRERCRRPISTGSASLERINTEIDRVWGPVSHLNSVVSSPPLREAFNRCLPLIAEFGTELGQNETLYRHFSTLAGAASTPAKPVEQQLIAQRAARFPARRRHADGSDRGSASASSCSSSPRSRRSSSRTSWTRPTRSSIARPTAPRSTGLPQFVLDRAAALAAERGIEGWCLRLDPPTYQTVLAHAESPALREKYYQAWVTRASDQGPHAGRWDNSAADRGDPRAAPRSRAARRLQDVRRVLAGDEDGRVAEPRHRVPARSRAAQPRRRARRARDADGLRGPQARRRGTSRSTPSALKQEKLELAEEELRPYFPLPRVLDGLFKLVRHAVRPHASPKRRAPDVWHDSVRYYELKRPDGTLVGSFFTDLFARPNKRGGAWMDGCVSRAQAERRERKRRSPTSSATSTRRPATSRRCSRTRKSSRCSTSSATRCTTCLTEVDYPSIAGMNGVAWDAVELPSQFLENFTWRPEVLARHRPALRDRRAAAARQDRDVEPLADVPRGARDGAPARVRAVRLPAARRVHAGARLARAGDPRRGAPRGRRRRAAARYNRFPHAFGHVFGGGYAAGYYSYKWAEVLAADAFAAFEEAGVFDRATAERFRRAVLATRRQPQRARRVHRVPRPAARARRVAAASRGIAAAPRLQHVKVATWNVNSLRVRLAHVLEVARARAARPARAARDQAQGRELPGRRVPRTRLLRDVRRPVRATTASRSSRATPPSAVALRDWRRLRRRAEARARRDVRRRCASGACTCRTARASIPTSTPTSSSGSRRCACCSRRARAPSSHCCVVGDFNIAPDDRDVHNPAAWAGQGALHAGRASGARRDLRAWAARHVSAVRPAAREDLQLVGLPSRRVSPQPGAADRPRARLARR